MEHLICPPPLRRGDRVAIVSLSSGMLGVDPFDQPGVEAYKGWMFKALGKT